MSVKVVDLFKPNVYALKGFGVSTPPLPSGSCEYVSQEKVCSEQSKKADSYDGGFVWVSWIDPLKVESGYCRKRSNHTEDVNQERTNYTFHTDRLASWTCNFYNYTLTHIYIQACYQSI